MPKRNVVFIGPVASHGFFNGQARKGPTLVEQLDKANRQAMQKRAEIEKGLEEAERKRILEAKIESERIAKGRTFQDKINLHFQNKPQRGKIR